MKSIELKLRDRVFHADITKSDGILFLSTLFNDAENSLFEAGKTTEALEKFKQRQMASYTSRLEGVSEAKKQLIEKEIDEEFAQFIYQSCERQPSLRRALAARTREIFPEMPTEWVFWNSDTSFGFRLEPDEMMSLVMTIIQPTLAEETPIKKSKPEIGEVKILPTREAVTLQNNKRTKKRGYSDYA